MISRRNFSKILGSSLLFSALRLDAAEEQQVYINLPSYRLRFYSGSEMIDLPVSIGKGTRGKDATPILDGFLTEKRRNMNIRYGKDYPELGIVKGDIIRWDHTFDANGKPYEHRMPYERMRAIQMKLTGDHSDKFVIHSSTDEFTLGTPASSGCIRVGLDDMLRLYNAVAPTVRDGPIDKIPLAIRYNVIETDDNNAVFHANIYHKDLDYGEEFRKALADRNIDPDLFDAQKAETTYQKDSEDFEKAYIKILDTLDKSWPHNFLDTRLKSRLHRTYGLNDFLV